VRYLKQKEINIDLSSRVKNYVRWLEDQEQIARNLEQQLLEDLSSNLKNEITCLVNGKIIDQILFLKDRFSISLLTKVIFAFKEQSW
jgi:hypothetical protein